MGRSSMDSFRKPESSDNIADFMCWKRASWTLDWRVVCEYLKDQIDEVDVCIVFTVPILDSNQLPIPFRIDGTRDGPRRLRNGETDDLYSF